MIGTNVASPADKDGVINCAEQIQLTNMLASKAPRLRLRDLLAQIFVSLICLAQLITPSLSAGDATFVQNCASDFHHSLSHRPSLLPIEHFSEVQGLLDRLCLLGGKLGTQPKRCWPTGGFSISVWPSVCTYVFTLISFVLFCQYTSDP